MVWHKYRPESRYIQPPQPKTNLASKNIFYLVLIIPTSLLGIGTAVSIIERLTKLCSVSPNYRPLNSPRFALDPFMWGYFLALVMISSEISCSLSLPGAPHLSLIAMPVPSLMLLLATLLAISLGLNGLDIPAPFRLGSTGKGEEEVRPAIFYVVEDVVAVDGNGGKDYRLALNARYASSETFRAMMFNLSVVWMLLFYIAGAGLTALICVLSGKGTDAQMIALGISWASPFALGGLMAWRTILYVQGCLKRERTEGVVSRNETTPLLAG